MYIVQRAYKFIHRKFTHTVHGSSINYWKKENERVLLYLIRNAFSLTCDRMIEGCLNIWGV